MKQSQTVDGADATHIDIEGLMPSTTYTISIWPNTFSFGVIQNDEELMISTLAASGTSLSILLRNNYRPYFVLSLQVNFKTAGENVLPLFKYLLPENIVNHFTAIFSFY